MALALFRCRSGHEVRWASSSVPDAYVLDVWPCPICDQLLTFWDVRP